MKKLLFAKPPKQVKKRRMGIHPRLTPIRKLQVILDGLVRDFVILRDEKCICCGTRQNLTPGHLITRGCKSVRWDQLNVHAQCRNCNFQHEFRPEIMTQKFIDLYGNDAYNELVAASRLIKKWSRTDLEEEIRKYKSTL